MNEEFPQRLMGAAREISGISAVAFAAWFFAQNFPHYDERIKFYENRILGLETILGDIADGEHFRMYGSAVSPEVKENYVEVLLVEDLNEDSDLQKTKRDLVEAQDLLKELKDKRNLFLLKFFSLLGLGFFGIKNTRSSVYTYFANKLDKNRPGIDSIQRSYERYYRTQENDSPYSGPKGGDAGRFAEVVKKYKNS